MAHAGARCCNNASSTEYASNWSCASSTSRLAMKFGDLSDSGPQGFDGAHRLNPGCDAELQWHRSNRTYSDRGPEKTIILLEHNATLAERPLIRQVLQGTH